MSGQAQEFTFIHLNAGKKQNTRAIKRHVSNQTNRRKRQEAVRRYQESLQQVVEQSGSASEASTSPDQRSDRSYTAASRPRITDVSSEVSSSTEYDDEYTEFEVQRQPTRWHTVQAEGYWPAYVQWLTRQFNVPLSPQPAQSPRKPHKAWKVLDSSHSRIYATASSQYVARSIPRIDSPSEHSRVQRALKTCSDFIHGMYESKWKFTWQKTQWFQGSMLPLGIWRESFPLAVEFIEAGKYREAFYILNAALSVTPAFFQEDNPGLLIAFLGAMMYTTQISDRRLSALIRSHVTQLSMAHLGSNNPISQLLVEQMHAGDVAQGRTDLLSVAVIATFSELLGPQHYIPLSFKFGYLRRQLVCGDYNGALSAISDLEKVWNDEKMPAAQLPKFLAFEKAKVQNAQLKAQSINRREDRPATVDLSVMAESSVQLPVFIPGKGPALAPLQSAILRKLGKHLLLGSHYALALYIYTRIPELFDVKPEVEPLPATKQDPLTLPDTIARILKNHLEEEMESSK